MIDKNSVIENEDVLDEDYDEMMDYEYFDDDEDEDTSKPLPKSTTKDSPSFEVIYGYQLEEGEEPLSRVIGHENQKKEILNVIGWFKRSKELKEKGVSIPRGVILFGDPGNGKSLLIKEIIRCVDAPVFVFQGEQTNIVQGIVDVFREAREAKYRCC